MTPYRIPGRHLFRIALDALREARWINRRLLLFGGSLCALLVVSLLVTGWRLYTANGLTAPSGQPLAWDFLNVFAGAKAAASGHARFVYDNQWFRSFELSIVGPKALPWIYSYPPVMLLLSLPLGFFPYVSALVVWTVLGAASIFAPLQRLVGWRAAGLAVIGTPAAFYNLTFGQNGYFTGALFGGGLMLLERRPVVAGICFACLTYKPHLGVLLPVALAAGGYWRAFAAAAAMVVVLVLVSLAVFGPETWVGFVGQMAVNRHLLEIDSHPYRWPTVFAAARLLGAGPPVAYVAQLISSVLAMAAVWWVWRTPGSIEAKSAALTAAIFLATPYAWDHDTVVLIFAAAWLARLGMRTGFLPWERLAVVALVVLPLPTITVSVLAGVPLGPVILWLALVLLMRRALAPPVAASAGPRCDKPASRRAHDPMEAAP